MASRPPPPRARRRSTPASRRARRRAGRGAAGPRTPPVPPRARGRRLGAHAAYDESHRLVDQVAGGGEQLVELGVDLVVPLEHHHVAGAVALQQGGALDHRVQLAAVLDRRELVVGAADDRRRHAAHRVHGLELLQRAERREEVGDHAERRGREHLVDELDVPGRYGVAERQLVGRDQRDRAPDLAEPVDGAVPARQRRDQPGANCPPTVEGSSGSTTRCGSTPPAVVPIRPTPTTRSPNSSGCSSASATMVMPPIEWPTSTTGPSGTASSSTRSRSLAELLDVGVLLGRPAGAAVGALVVVDRADQAAVGRALEVPRVQVERVAVHEHDGQLGVPTARAHPLAAGHRGVELVDLDVQRVRRRRPPRSAAGSAASRTACCPRPRGGR